MLDFVTKILLHFKIWKLEKKNFVNDCSVWVECTSRQVIFLSLGLACLCFRK